MDIRIDAILSVTDIPECISIKQIQQASVQDQTLTAFKKTSISVDLLCTRDEVHS